MESEIHHGSKIGRFIVTGELGSGGMGVVYSAHDRELDRRVALKVLRAAAATEEERMRMLREGQAMARVTHPNVITVYEVGVEGNLVFLAEELLDAGTLGSWLDKQQRGEKDIVDKFIAAGHGLAAAHKAGLVHRDFKPDNVLLGKDGRVRVSDFGLARALGPDEENLPAATRANMARAQMDLSRSPMSPLTRTGAVMGTPMFMAPEQHLGERADERSDQFAFCVALYRALYGDWPFPGKTSVALADAVIGGRMQKPPKQIPARLRKILLRGLATKPADRYPNMDALLADLSAAPSRRGRTMLFAALGLVVIAGGVVGGWALKQHEETIAAPPLPKFDPKMTPDKSVEWFSLAVERDQLDDAVEKYDMAGALARQNQQEAQASIASSSGALVLALRGRLDLAQAHLKDAEVNKGEDPLAIAYVDLAGASIASARGELDKAIDKAKACASSFAQHVPELAAMCFQIQAQAIANHGDPAMARKTYEQGRALVSHDEAEPRKLAIEIALVGLDLDEGKSDAAIAMATTLQATAEQSIGPTSSVGDRAAILLSRAHSAAAETQAALADLDHVKADQIQTFDLQVEARIARGEALVLLGDPDEGYKQLDAARADATQQGYAGLALEARRGRVEVMVMTAAPDAEKQQKQLIEDARKAGFGRIAHLVESIAR
ncbi:MAG: serine/threonine-protein kinase [Kofleriaceae bacterium]